MDATTAHPPVLRGTGPATTAPRVLVVTGSVGAGHDGAAHELAARLRTAGATAEVRDFLDATPAPVRRLLRDGYGLTVEHAPLAFELLFQSLERRGPMWWTEQQLCATGRRTLLTWVGQTRPDVIVSTFPLASQALGQLTDRGLLTVPFLTYLTDPAVHASWLHPAAAGHLTVTGATAAQGSSDYGTTFTVAGPLVPARFAAPLSLPQLVTLRQDLDLPAGRPVALLVAGSLGMGDVLTSARDVAGAGWTPLVLCGRNDRLHAQVDAVAGAVALGWRADVHHLMQLADALVHNAGGLSVTEALVAGLPAVTYRSITGHGAANARVLADSGLAPWPTTPVDLAAALDTCRTTSRQTPTWVDATDVVLAAVPATVAAT